jgi:hypothetical protein
MAVGKDRPSVVEVLRHVVDLDADALAIGEMREHAVA